MNEPVLFAAVGQRMPGGSGPLGINLYRMDGRSGALTFEENVLPEITAGELLADGKRDLLFAVNETGELRDPPESGAGIYSFHLDRMHRHLELLGQQKTLLPYPCYLCLDQSGKYLIVSHNGDKNHVTRIRPLADGSFTSDTVYDDAALIVFQVLPDGKIGRICDAAVAPAQGMSGKLAIRPGAPEGITASTGVQPHLHCVAQSPDGLLTVAVDIGQSCLYSYRLEQDTGHLALLSTCAVRPAAQIRHGLFHSKNPLFYANFEDIPYVAVFACDGRSGAMHETARVRTLPDETQPAGSNALALHPNGETLYCSCLNDTISVFSLKTGGIPRREQTIACGGNRPRTLCITPDGEWLLSGNNRSHTIAVFRIQPDGTLVNSGQEAQHVMPSGMQAFPAFE